MLPADELETLYRIVSPAMVEVFDPYRELIGRFP